MNPSTNRGEGTSSTSDPNLTKSKDNQSSSSAAQHEQPGDDPDDSPQPTAGTSEGTLGFWAIMVGLWLAAIVSALDGSVVSTALPTIVREIGLGANYVWAANIYFLTTAAFPPFFGQLADLFGRRWLFIGTVAIFVLGSGLCAGAENPATFIAARGVQGLGGGGINMLLDLIVCDLVPLKDRGKYMGLLFGIATLAAAVGPLIGGALTSAGAWRWVFWINLPIGGLCIVISGFSLKVKHAKQGDWLQRLGRIDWVGTIILVGSTVSVLWALAYGGSLEPFSNHTIIATLVVGLVGLGLFVDWEATPLCKTPQVPLRLFSNRTSSVGFVLTFSNTLLAIWVVYMFPVYLQAVRGYSALWSGVWLLPYVLAFPFASAIGGNVMAKTGRYKPIHLIGFAFCTLACGLCALLNRSSHGALIVFFQIFWSIGIATPIACLLTAVQADLTEKDNAASTGTWAFIRSYGTIWGVTIPAAIFNNRFDQLLDTIDDPSARSLLSNGQAYAGASSGLTDMFPRVVRDQILNVYTLSLQRVWQLGAIFAGLSFLVAFLEREIKLRDEVNTDFAMENAAKKDTINETESGATLALG
ncbi:major facilitator superfamily domain-containing protein [Xylaria palmicola]|nr:major facilitator superfamily domain-containing protein [Xylaria palmicola]